MLHGISDWAEWCKIYCVTPYKYKLHLAKYSNCNTQFRPDTDVIPITSLYNILAVTMLGVPNHREGIHWLKPAQNPCSLWNLFASCWVFILCWAEPWIHSPRAGLANSWGNIYTTSSSTQLWSSQLIHLSVESCLSKTKATLWSLLCWNKLCFLWKSCGQLHPTLFSELHEHIALAHLLWAFCSCRVSLVNHNRG